MLVLQKARSKASSFLSLACALVSLSFLTLGAAGCADRHSTPAPTSTPTLEPPPLYPYFPMYTLTPFAPTATPAARPIPPLSAAPPASTPPSLPDWIADVSPAPGSRVDASQMEGICVWPADEWLDRSYPALQSLFYAGERARDHLILRVNGVIPSELTWQDIIVPNSTHPGTAWAGTRAYLKFCWRVELATGPYEVTLSYPTEKGSAALTWHFVSD